MLRALCVITVSNQSLKLNIQNSVEKFLRNEINLEHLRSSLEINGRALEGMPYAQIKEMDELEYKLTMSQFHDEEDCETDIDQAISAINIWLENIPLYI